MSCIIRHMVGEVEVIALTDGVGQFGNEQFPDTDPTEIKNLLAAAKKDVIETNFNAFVIRSKDETMLVDTGARDLFGPTAGFLLDALTEAEITPQDINRLFISHMHPDHCAGAVSSDGAAVFANAELILSDLEYAYWRDYSNFEGKGDLAENAYGLTKSVFDAYHERLTPVVGAADLDHGVHVVPLFGHTPGHCGLRVSDGDNQFVTVSDIAHAVDLQLANPDIGVVYDMDGDTAAIARKSMLDELATEGIACSGGHFLYPGIGRIKRAGAGYRYSAIDQE
jgi:glyoxylase-like metal-dependent hydrolase (beta-lactamase superfamily II)